MWFSILSRFHYSRVNKKATAEVQGKSENGIETERFFSRLGGNKSGINSATEIFLFITCLLFPFASTSFCVIIIKMITLYCWLPDAFEIKVFLSLK